MQRWRDFSDDDIVILTSHTSCRITLALPIVFLNTSCRLSYREYCRYPLIDITYLLSVIAMMLALYSAFAPDFYTYSDEEDVTGERYVCVFTSMFYETDEVTSAAFAFLVSAWLFSACGGGVISERYQEGYGDHDELLPGISCCLSVWYSLVGTLGLLSLVSVPHVDTFESA